MDLLKVKIFKSENTAELEKLINDWFAENMAARMRHVKQSSTQYDTTVTLFYYCEPQSPLQPQPQGQP